MNPTLTTQPGHHTLNEILSQPQSWNACLSRRADSRELEAAVRLWRRSAEWLLVGCGSSYYLALTAAATFNHLGLPARAVPASEVLLYPEITISPGREVIPILISRSGQTSEVIRAARLLEERKGRTMAISCGSGTPLESVSSVTLKLLDADEQSTVMTRSFTSMLLGLQYLAARVAANEAFRSALV